MARSGYARAAAASVMQARGQNQQIEGTHDPDH